MVGSTFFSGQGVPWVINHWFPAKGRGAALGIAFCGGSIGNIFLQPATQTLLKHYMTGNTKTGHLTSMAPFFIFAVALLVIPKITYAPAERQIPIKYKVLKLTFCKALPTIGETRNSTTAPKVKIK